MGGFDLVVYNPSLTYAGKGSPGSEVGRPVEARFTGLTVDAGWVSGAPITDTPSSSLCLRDVGPVLGLDTPLVVAGTCLAVTQALFQEMNLWVSYRVVLRDDNLTSAATSNATTCINYNTHITYLDKLFPSNISQITFAHLLILRECSVLPVQELGSVELAASQG